MANIPHSDAILIAAALGALFLIVVFYTFRKRSTKTLAAPPAQTPVIPENPPVKLTTPTPQVPVDSIPPRQRQKPAVSFYPAYPKTDGLKTVSAFRQFSPDEEFDTAATQKSESAYEWE